VWCMAVLELETGHRGEELGGKLHPAPLRQWYSRDMTDQPAQQRVLEVDGRRRISLGALAAHDRYIAEVAEDGTITLTPAVVLPAARARELDEFLDHPGTGGRRKRP
jgi:hypothetical protein